MTHYSSQEIDEIVDTLRRAKDRSKPAHILFGGGCSKSAGIPLAPELVTEIHELYPARCQKLADADRKKYGACMKLLSPNERRDLLAPYLTKARINWAHIALAQFMKEQFIERALTVNFDNLLARACGLLSLYPAIYDFGSAPTAEVSLIVSPAILHLHGQGHGVVLLNTEDETKKHSEKIAPILQEGLDRPLIVIGYSGSADDVLRILREHYRGREYLFWLSHNEESDPAIRQIADAHDYFRCVDGVDADRFLIELAQKLRCWPPNICINPIGHLLAELAPVADYPTAPENDINILSRTRSRLAELEKSEKQRVSRDIEKLLFEGRYGEVVRAYEAAVSLGHVTKIQRNLAAAAIMMQGNSMVERGQRSVDPKIAAKRFRDAETKYEAALRLTPRNAGILYNFGVALMRRAHRSTNSADAAELLKQAETKYNAALRINSNVPATLSARGSAMLEIAKLTRNKRKAGRLLKTSVESMRRAYELGHTSTYNLACAYALLGRADDCRFALEFAEKAGTLPALVHLEADEDFKALYSQRWFKALKRRLARKAA